MKEKVQNLKHIHNFKKKQRKLAVISEEELAPPGQIDVMLSSSSAAASSSGVTPVRARTQAFEELTSSNLRGTPRVVGHRRTDSAASAASAASVESATSTLATRADLITPQIQQSVDLFSNDLTIPLRGLIQYTDRYDKANQLYTTHKNQIKKYCLSQFGFSYSTSYNIRERTA